MANDDHIGLLMKGSAVWNAWRDKNPHTFPNLNKADLSDADLRGADLSDADLRGADLSGANLRRAVLVGAECSSETDFSGARLVYADFSGVNLNRVPFIEANLNGANLSGADLTGANFYAADLLRANLTGANLSGATLLAARLMNTDLTGADLTGCRVYGVSAWGLKLDERSKQQNLVITPHDEPEITVDNIEVAQFVYLLLHNQKIRDVIDTIGKKGVLLLGRFTEGRMVILERLKNKLRDLGYVPMVFNFDKPETKDFTETVRLLAGLSRFVIADITNPRSAPLELQATIPNCMVPFVPILEKGEEPFAMLADLWIKHRDWVLDPIRYSSVDRLLEVLESEIVRPAQVRFDELLAKKAEQLRIRDV